MNGEHLSYMATQQQPGQAAGASAAETAVKLVAPCLDKIVSVRRIPFRGRLHCSSQGNKILSVALVSLPQAASSRKHQKLITDAKALPVRFLLVITPLLVSDASEREAFLARVQH